MSPNVSALRASLPALLVLMLAGCTGDRLAGLMAPQPSAAPAAAAPNAPPLNMLGRWLLSSQGGGQCYMTFSAASVAARNGTIAPEGGCPGKFFTSRKWDFERGSLVMRDHNGKPLAQFSAARGGFNGKTTSGEPVALMR